LFFVIVFYYYTLFFLVYFFGNLLKEIIEFFKRVFWNFFDFKWIVGTIVGLTGMIGQYTSYRRGFFFTATIVLEEIWTHKFRIFNNYNFFWRRWLFKQLKFKIRLFFIKRVSTSIKIIVSLFWEIACKCTSKCISENIGGISFQVFFWLSWSIRLIGLQPRSTKTIWGYPLTAKKVSFGKSSLRVGLPIAWAWTCF